MDDWVDRAADLIADLPEDVPGAVIDNKIAQAKYPDRVDEDGVVDPGAVESVTADERQRVAERLEAETETLREGAAADLDRLSQAIRPSSET